MKIVNILVVVALAVYGTNSQFSYTTTDDVLTFEYDDTEDPAEYYNWGYDVDDEEFLKLSQDQTSEVYDYESELNEQNVYDKKTYMKNNKSLLISPYFRLSKTGNGYVGKQLEYLKKKERGNGGFEFTDELNDIIIQGVDFTFDGSVAPFMRMSEAATGSVIKTLENRLSKNFVNWRSKKGIKEEKIDKSKLLTRSFMNTSHVALNSEGQIIKVQYSRIGLKNWKKNITNDVKLGQHPIFKNGDVAKRGHIRKVRKNLPNYEFTAFPNTLDLKPYTVFNDKLDEELGYYDYEKDDFYFLETMYFDENGKGVKKYTTDDA